MNLPIAQYQILYNKKDVTADISAQVIAIEYVDKLTGESDELGISIEDADKRWQGNWAPTKGDSLQLYIRLGSTQLNCGIFEIDETELNFSTSGDIFTVKALAAGIKKQMRTLNSYAHEDKSLREIANTVASGLGLTVIGNVPDIRLHRAHQFRETDLSFLNRIGADYGCVFSVRDTSLIFTYYKDLAGRKPSVTLKRTDIISGVLKDTTHKTFKKCRVRHHDPINKEVLEDEEDEDNPDFQNEGADELEIHTRVENKQQAKARAKYALFKNNSQGVGGDISTFGNPLLVSGNNVGILEVGSFNGNYQILEARHTLARDGGYLTSINIKRVAK